MRRTVLLTALTLLFAFSAFSSNDIYLDPELTFELVGEPAREQYLLPVLLPPIEGAFGSEFRTELRGVNTGSDPYGFRPKTFALLGVPLDPRFRNTLRLYATGATTVQVQIGNETHQLTLPGGGHVFDPSYAQWTAFPTGTGTTNVIVTPAANGPAVWGFISVTNNDTQHITTITPY